MAAAAAAELQQPPADGVGVYRSRRPRASPLYRLLERHFRELSLVWDERFALTSGEWRAVIPKVVDQFLACGLLEHGFARIRCDACAHEYLLAFSCKCRYFCPRCHAKRLARWSLWLDQTLLAPVPHRQVVLTLPPDRGAPRRAGDGHPPRPRPVTPTRNPPDPWVRGPLACPAVPGAAALRPPTAGLAGAGTASAPWRCRPLAPGREGTPSEPALTLGGAKEIPIPHNRRCPESRPPAQGLR